MLPRGFFKTHLLAEAVARRSGHAQQSRTVARQKLFDPPNFAQVTLSTHDLLARAQALVHFSVNAARMLRAGLQILLATAHLKQIQKLILEEFGAGPGSKRPIVNRLTAREPRSHLRPRKFVRKNQLHVRGHAKLDQPQIVFGKIAARQRVMQQHRFETRCRRPILHAGRHFAKIQ